MLKTLFQFNETSKLTLKNITIIIGLFLLSVVMSGVYKSLIENFNFYQFPERRHFIHFNNWDNILLVLLIAPILEELVYRLGLRFTNKNLSLGLSSVFVFYLLSDLISQRNWFSLYHVIVFGSGLILYLLFLRIISLDVISFFKANRLKIYYLSILIFTYSHFDFNIPFYHSFFTLLPIFIGSVILTFLRLRYNIFVSIGIHILLNTPTLFILLNTWIFH